MQNKVAVILPVYSGDKPQYLRLSIDSILNQTYRNIYLYLGVDGPVGENLCETLDEYSAKENLSVIRYSQNRGLASVLNDLLQVCIQDGYKYIARMDADDICVNDRIEKQMNFLQLHPEIDVVGGSIEEIDEDGNSRNKIIIYPRTPEDCRAFFARRNPLAHPAVLFRLSFFDKAGCMYRPEYRQNQDTMLWFDALKQNVKMANINDVVLKFRMTENLFKKRRNGWAFAKKQLRDRLIINKELGYGFTARIFAYAMYIMLVSPPWLKKIAYKLFR